MQARPVEGITKRNRKGGPGKKAHMLGQTAEQSLVKPQPTPNGEPLILLPTFVTNYQSIFAEVVFSAAAVDRG
jgi:hypothetical protein